MKKLKYLFASLFILAFNILSFGQWESEDDDPVVPTPPPPEGEGGLSKTPIDMYEGMLMLAAVALIIGYYFYQKNRRLVR